MVNEALKEEMQQIHALTQKTLTPEQWNKMSEETKAQQEQGNLEKCTKHNH